MVLDAKVVDVVPGLPLAQGAQVVLGVVLVVEVFSELTLTLVRQEALHAHRLL